MATLYLSAQSVVLDLLRYIGVTGFTAPDNDQALNQPGLDADDTRRAIIAINSALQTIQKYGPQSLKFDRRSAAFVAPGTVSLTINGATPKTATPTVQPPAWMLGCSIMLSGDAEMNRIMAIAPGTPFLVTLLRAYLGTPGAGIAATVYSDCATLDADVQAVLEPVTGPNQQRFWPAKDIDEFERLRDRYRGWPFGFASGYGTLNNNLIGAPERYIVERQRSGVPFLRVTPAPATPVNASFQAKLRAERITSDVIDLTGATDPAYTFTSLHNDEVESVLLPLARWRFFVHPALKNAETRAAVKAEYDEVMLALRYGTTFSPVVSTQRARYI